MRKKDIETLRKTQHFAARFGFITRELFFEYLCRKGRSQQYAQWKALVDDGWFTKSTHDGRVLYLSRKSRKILGAGCVPSRSLMYVDHDSLMGAFLLSLNRTGLILRAWTEADLTRAPGDAHRLLGADRFAKIPDLILDLRAHHGFLRVAVEIEKTRKSRNRYSQIALSYRLMPRVDLVIFGCDSEATVMEVRRAFQGEAFLRAKKFPGTFLLKDFAESEFAARFQFQDRDFEIGEFLRAATRLDDLEFPTRADKLPEEIQHSKTEKSEAA